MSNAPITVITVITGKMQFRFFSVPLCEISVSSVFRFLSLGPQNTLYFRPFSHAATGDKSAMGVSSP